MSIGHIEHKYYSLSVERPINITRYEFNKIVILINNDK